MSADNDIAPQSIVVSDSGPLSRLLNQSLGILLDFDFSTFALFPPQLPDSLRQSCPHVAFSPALNDLPVQRRGDQDRLDVFLKVLSCAPQTIARRRGQVDCQLPLQGVDREGFEGKMRYECTPFVLGQFLLMPIIQECRGEGAGDGEEDQPVSGRKSEAEVW